MHFILPSKQTNRRFKRYASELFKTLGVHTLNNSEGFGEVIAVANCARNMDHKLSAARAVESGKVFLHSTQFSARATAHGRPDNSGGGEFYSRKTIIMGAAKAADWMGLIVDGIVSADSTRLPSITTAGGHKMATLPTLGMDKVSALYLWLACSCY